MPRRSMYAKTDNNSGYLTKSKSAGPYAPDLTGDAVVDGKSYRFDVWKESKGRQVVRFTPIL